MSKQKKNSTEIEIPTIPPISILGGIEWDVPSAEPIKQEYEYEVKNLQFGSGVLYAGSSIKKILYEMAVKGWRYRQCIEVNIHEAVIVFERKVR